MSPAPLQCPPAAPSREHSSNLWVGSNSTQQHQLPTRTITCGDNSLNISTTPSLQSQPAQQTISTNSNRAVGRPRPARFVAVPRYLWTNATAVLTDKICTNQPLPQPAVGTLLQQIPATYAVELFWGQLLLSRSFRVQLHSLMRLYPLHL